MLCRTSLVCQVCKDIILSCRDLTEGKFLTPKICSFSLDPEALKRFDELSLKVNASQSMCTPASKMEFPLGKACRSKTWAPFECTCSVGGTGSLS